MEPSHRLREPAKLSGSVNQLLDMYALAASVAGVGLLALVEPAEAKIVYTPAHVSIGNGGVQTYVLDLNHDGMGDFSFQTGSSCDFRCIYGLTVWAESHQGKGIESGKRFNARALRRGAKIGGSRAFIDSGIDMAYIYRTSEGKSEKFGYWFNVTNRYLGLKFQIKGKTHYGWARLDVHVNRVKVSATLTGYAYETVPDKAIIAGQIKGADDSSIEKPNASLTVPAPKPATLGMLAGRSARTLPSGAPEGVGRRKLSSELAFETNFPRSC